MPITFSHARLTADELAIVDADLARDGLVRLAEPRPQATLGRRTREQAEAAAIEMAAHRDPERPQYRWLLWNIAEEDGYASAVVFVLQVAPILKTRDLAGATVAWAELPAGRYLWQREHSGYWSERWEVEPGQGHTNGRVYGAEIVDTMLLALGQGLDVYALCELGRRP